jgi:hypothetical protein
VTANGNASVPLHYLLRRQKLVATNTTTKTNLASALGADTSAPDVISTKDGTTANTLADVATTAKRPAFPTQLGGGRYGDDVLLSNVISFEVKVSWQQQSSGATVLGNPGRLFANNTDFPYDTFAPTFSPSLFDTLSPSTVPVRVLALQVRVRVYDPKMKQARQATYVFTP